MARKVLLLFAITIVAPALGAATGSKPATGSVLGVGTVFLPNPVADLGDPTLTDQKDADYATLSPAYHDVLLSNLDGSGFLIGNWAQVVSETGDRAYSPSNEFRYHRDDDVDVSIIIEIGEGRATTGGRPREYWAERCGDVNKRRRLVA